MRKVVGIGETILDVIFQNNQPQKAVAGGSTFNCMVSLARCGVSTAFVSELGDDPVGRMIESFMRENGLSTQHIYRFRDGSSPVAMAFLDDQCKASYQFYLNYPEQRLQIPFPEIQATDTVVFGSYFAVNPLLRPRVKAFLDYAQNQGAFIYYDINFRQAHQAERALLLDTFRENFAYASVVRCSDEDLEVLFPGRNRNEIYQQEIAPLCPFLIVTRGQENIELRTPSGMMTFPVEKIEPISTIGAGDNFNAGFLYQWMQEELHINNLTDAQWNSLVDSGKAFATEVCRSLDNYVDRR